MTIKSRDERNDDNDTDHLKHTLFLVNVLSVFNFGEFALKHYSPWLVLGKAKAQTI